MSIGVILFVVLLVLKLSHLIAWSWWWVTAPLWVSLLLTLILYAIAGLIFGGMLRR